MSKQAHYCRIGWKPSLLTLAEVDKKTGLCKLANDKGEVVVTDLPYLEDPSKIAPEALPKSYAAPVDAPAPAKPSRKKGSAAEEAGGEEDTSAASGGAGADPLGPIAGGAE